MSRKFDLYASIVFFLIGLGFVWESQKISQSVFGSNVGSNIFPAGLGAVLMLLSIKLLFEAMRMQKEEPADRRPDYLRVLLIIGAATVYGFYLEIIGYVIGTFMFLLFAFQVIERGKWLASILVSAGFTGVVYYAFVHLLQGTLPGWPVFIQ
jgi:putative tricarboxylic transport membrane protein